MSSALKILRVLVKQLAATEPTMELSTELLSLYANDSHKSDGLYPRQCLDLIASLTISVSETRIVIDGLDECVPDVQEDLIDSLVQVSKLLKTRLKLFITCRPHLRRILAPLTDWHISVPEHNQEAFELMIRTSIEQAAARPRLRATYQREPDHLDQQEIRALVISAGGMYRWVDMALTFLHHPPVDFWQLKARLRQLPHLTDLYQLYDQMWEDYMKLLSPKSKEVVKIAMLFLIHGFNLAGTSHRHIIEACTFLQTKTLELGYSASELIALCPGFLIQPAEWESDNSFESLKFSFSLVETTESPIDASETEKETVKKPANLAKSKRDLITIPHVSVTD